MDGFEKEYFESLRNLSLNYNDKRQDIAESRIKMFSAALARQILDESQEFDLILSAGNSGVFMLEITKFVYKSLNKKLPETFSIPLYRKITDEKNEVLFNNKSIHELRKINDPKNILFVDDEIMRGLTAKTCFELLRTAKPDIEHFDVTIIAENHFFEWHYSLPNISVRFFAYSRLIQWLNGNISFILPDTFLSQIQKVYPKINSHNQALALVLGGKVKKLKNNIPYYDFEPEKIIAKSLPDYTEMKLEIINRIDNLVNLGVNEYFEGKINFRY